MQMPVQTEYLLTSYGTEEDKKGDGQSAPISKTRAIGSNRSQPVPITWDCTATTILLSLPSISQSSPVPTPLTLRYNA